MIKELCEYGGPICEKKYGQWNHVALKEEFISIELVIDPDGSFREFIAFEKKPTISEALTAKKGKARLLLDKAEEVLCYGGNKSNKKHELFLNKLAKYRRMHELEPIFAFYNQNRRKGIDKALKEFETAIPNEKFRRGNIGFRIQTEGIRLHERSEVLRKIIDEYSAQKENVHKRKCSVCNTEDYPVEDTPHGMIKGVLNGKSSGCALISYNETAFESYELTGNYNSSICANCARSYVEGLSSLLSAGNEVVETKSKKEKTYFRYTNRKKLGADTALVYWTRKNSSLSIIDQLEAPNSEDVARLIESVSSGGANDNRYLEADKFYSFTLSGSAARIVVRDWIETSLFDLRESIVKWFRDIAIAEYDWDLKQLKLRYARLYDLARSCQRKNADGAYDKDDTSPARVAMHLWNAALKNTALPSWILTRVLQRARLDKRGITPDRAALIKLILKRTYKEGDFIIMEKTNDEPKPVSYVCGQIFAKLESIQYATLGDRNAGIRERYFTYAMISPSSAFGRLFNLNSKHFTKLKNDKPGLAIKLDRELQELCKDVDINAFPPMFTLEQQGQFAIGYYHQRQSQFNSTTKN